MVEARKLFTALFSAFHQVCRRNGIQLMISVIPTKMEFQMLIDPDEQAKIALQPRQIADYVAGVAKEYGIPYLDLFSAFERDEDPFRLYISSEYHFNEAGHAFVGEKLTDFFNEHEKQREPVLTP